MLDLYIMASMRFELVTFDHKMSHSTTVQDCLFLHIFIFVKKLKHHQYYTFLVNFHNMHRKKSSQILVEHSCLLIYLSIYEIQVEHRINNLVMSQKERKLTKIFIVCLQLLPPFSTVYQPNKTTQLHKHKYTVCVRTKY